MTIGRRELLSALLAGSAGLGAVTLAPLRPRAEERVVRLAGSPMGDPGDWSGFTERTGWMVAPLSISDASATIRSLLLTEVHGGGDLDLLHAIGGMTHALVTNGLIDPIETERLKNWAGNDYIQTFFAPEAPGSDFIRNGRGIYAVPTVLQGDSFAYLPELTGKLDSYGALFDPEWKGRVAIENNVWTSGLKTALYLRESGLAAIRDPGNMSPGEIRIVVDYLISLKQAGQFQSLWTSSEESVRMLVEKQVAVIDCGEPTVTAANARGVNAVYAAPVEGYLLWALTASIIHDDDRPEAKTQAAYDLIDFLLDGWYGTTIGLARGFMTNPMALDHVEDNADDYSPDQRVKIQALDSAGRLKFQKGGVWRNRWPEHRKAYLAEWDRLVAA